MDDFLCIAHRGASGHRPENTLAAFEYALELGCDWLELDVYAVEGELIVIHDDTLDRTTNGHGPVMGSTLANIRTLDAGDGEPVPTLTDVIELVDHRAAINIELKGPATVTPVNQLLRDLTAAGWSSEEFLISSFDHEQLGAVASGLRRGVLFGRDVSDWLPRARALAPWSVNFSRRSVTPDVASASTTAGYHTLVYTVDDVNEMQQMVDIGFSGIFTNFPDRALALIEQLKV
jgi:glycerophosphoryl diester phosphodiesterase